MLLTTEEDLKNGVLTHLQKPTSLSASSQKKGKGKKKKGKKIAPQGKIGKPKPKRAVEDTCYHCNKIGHWKRNCPEYLAQVRRDRASTSGIFIFPVIDISLSCDAVSSNWILDSACPVHICNSLQGLKESKKLKPGDMHLRFGSGDSLDAATVGVYEISLPSGRFLLNDYYFVPGCVANIISLFVLDTEGFCVNIKNSSLYLYDKNNILILQCPNENGHYILHTSRDILNTMTNK